MYIKQQCEPPSAESLRTQRKPTREGRPAENALTISADGCYEPGYPPTGGTGLATGRLGYPLERR